LAIALFLWCGFGFSETILHTTYSDFIGGTFERTTVLSPDPDGVDDGAISFPVSLPTIKTLIIYPPEEFPSNTAWRLNLYERDGNPPVDIRAYGISIEEFQRVSSVRERFQAVSFEDGLRHSLSLEFFDAIIFGVADVYGYHDLNALAVNAVREFASLGNKVIIFTHSTVWNADWDRHTNFNSLMDIHNLRTEPQGTYDTFNVVVKYRDISHPVLNSPFILPDTMPISYTHRRGQIPDENELLYIGNIYTDYQGTYFSCHYNPVTGSYGVFLNYGHQAGAPFEWDAKSTINALFLTFHDSLLTGSYISPLIEIAPGIGSIVLLETTVSANGLGSVILRVRSSSDGVVFSDWIMVAPGTRTRIQLERYFQYQLLLSGYSLAAPVVHWIKFDYARVLINAELESPPEGAISSCPSQAITFRINSLNGIDSSSLRLEINGSIFTIDSPSLSLFDPAMLVFNPDTPYTPGETLNFVLSGIRDTLGFEAPPIASYFIVDISPPYVTAFYPSPETLLPHFPESLWFNIYEDFTTINWDSLYLIVGENRYSLHSEEITQEGNRLVFHPRYGVFPLGREYEVRLGGLTDTPMLCEPNRMRELNFRFSVGSFLFSLPETSAYAGDTIRLPILTIGGAGDFDSIKVGISVDSTVCVPVRIEAGDGWAQSSRLVIQRLSEGFIQFVFKGTIHIREGVMCYLVVAVKENALGWDFSQLRIEEVLINGAYNTDDVDGFLRILFVPEEWLVELQLSSEEHISLVSYGMSASATELFDFGVDRIFVPQPPGFIQAYFPLNDPDYPYITGLVRDIRGRTDFACWTLKTGTTSGTISWDSATLPQGENRINGIDMRTISSLPVSPGENFIITYSAPPPVDFTGELEPGWNLLSVPFSLARPDEPERIYPSMIGRPFHYDPRAGYSIADFLVPGKSYWVLSVTRWGIRYSGRLCGNLSIVLQPGWNMIGAPQRSISFASTNVHPPGAILPEMLYTFSTHANAYVHSDSLIPGKGYFLFALSPCTLEFSSPFEKQTEKNNKIIFSFSNGARLYIFTENGMDIPAPRLPSGEFGLTPHFVINDNPCLGISIHCRHELFLDLPQEMNEFRIEFFGERSFSLDLIGENDILELQEKKVYRVSRGRYRIKVGANLTVSPELVLYPNPFNEYVNIKVDGIKSDDEWRVQVINLLGEKMGEIKGTGTKLYRWDSSGIPSGIYFLSLEVGGAREVKRVLVLR